MRPSVTGVNQGNQPRPIEELLKGVAPRDRETVRQALERARESETELRQATSLMTDAQEIARFGHWQWVVAGDEVTWSDQLYRIFGLRPGEFTATFEAYLERVHEADRERVKAKIEKALATGEPYLIEHRILMPDGTVRSLRSQGQVVKAEDGSVERLVGVCQDITELVEAERARRAAELRFRNAFEHAPIGVALIALGDERARIDRGQPGALHAHRVLRAAS